MPKEDFVRARTDTYLKQHAEAILERLGLNMTDAINMFLVQVTIHGGLPFEVKVPADDPNLTKTRRELFEQWKRRVNEAIDEAEQDVAAGRIYTMEESRARTRETIERLKQGKNRV